MSDITKEMTDASLAKDALKRGEMGRVCADCNKSVSDGENCSCGSEVTKVPGMDFPVGATLISRTTGKRCTIGDSSWFN